MNRRTSTLAAALTFAATLTLAALSLSGCGAAAHANAPATPTATTTTGPACATPSRGELSVSQDDSGTSLCVAVGSKIDVYLHGTGDLRWAPVSASGTALQPAPNGKGTLMIGVTGGFFTAATPGTVTLTSTEPGCGATKTSCPPPSTFTVTVTVR